MGHIDSEDAASAENDFCFVWDLMERMHADLPPTVECRYIHSLRRLESMTAGSILHRWALFAGGGVSSHAVRVATDFFFHMYGISLPSGLASCARSMKASKPF